MSSPNITVSDLEIMSSAENYRKWMHSRIVPFIGQRILEVGSGIGNFTQLFLDRDLVVATDVHGPCIDQLKTRLADHHNVVTLQLDISDPAALQLESYACDTVVCLNVLEHVQEDLKALTHMHRLLKPGGRLVLLVPAFQFLYGTVDRSLQHYRRYTRNNLLPRMREAGFKVERSFYMNIIGMMGWLLNNRILKRREENAKQIHFFDRYISPAAERVERLIPPPFGLSLIAIGEK
jgi:ubiquinone/menaquinone biosynthesis C-methylase UbiE